MIENNLDGSNNPSKSTFRRWFSLVLWISGIILFIYVVGPWLMDLPYMRDVNKVIIEQGIEANTYFYTETPEFAEAELYMEDHMPPPSTEVVIIGWFVFALILWIGYRYIPLE